MCRTPASEYDAWEVDLETGHETRLTYFKFFIMSSLNYYPDDERFIFHAEGPTTFPGLNLPENDMNAAMKMIAEEQNKRKLAFKCATMKRGDILPYNSYSFAENVYPERLLLSKDGTRLFFEKGVGEYYLYSPDGNHRPVGGGGSVDSAAISPDGELLGVVAVGMAITIFQVKDGSRLEKIYAPSVRTESYYKDILPTLKILPDQPLRIINP